MSGYVCHEKGNFKIILLPFHHVRWNNVPRKFNGQSIYIQKKIISIMLGTKRRSFCMELFKKFNIPVSSQRILALISSICNRQHGKFKTNSDIHNISTRYRFNSRVE